MIRHMTTDRLEQWLKDDQAPGGEDFLLVNVLGEEDFEAAHIPGSHNVPVKRARLENEIERLAGGKEDPVVVYCASKDCEASTDAARRLSNAGFEQVFDYSGGMAAWIEAGNEVARSSDAAAGVSP